MINRTCLQCDNNMTFYSLEKEIRKKKQSAGRKEEADGWCLGKS